MLALGAAVEAGRIYLMPGGPQPVRHRLPNPAALVRAVDQNKSRHYTISLRFLNVQIAAGPALIPRDKAPRRPLGGEGKLRGPRANFDGRQFPPVTSIVTPVTKSASLEARKQMTFAWSAASATRRSGVRAISAACASCERLSQCGRMRSVSVRLGAMALIVTPYGPSSKASLRVKAIMPPLAAA